MKGETQNVVECFSLLLDCSIRFLFLLSHGFKSNVRHNRPHLASTQEHESHTVTKTGSQYNIKQNNNSLKKQNLLGQRNTFVTEKELNGTKGSEYRTRSRAVTPFADLYYVRPFPGLPSSLFPFFFFNSNRRTRRKFLNMPSAVIYVIITKAETINEMYCLSFDSFQLTGRRYQRSSKPLSSETKLCPEFN